MQRRIIEDIYEISYSRTNSVRSFFNFNRLFLDPIKIRDKNAIALKNFSNKFPEFIISGHLSDFQAYIQFKNDIQQRCLLVEAHEYNKYLNLINNDSRYSLVKGEEISKDSKERTIHNLIDDYWTYEKYLNNNFYACVLNVILVDLWLQKYIPQLFNSNNFTVESIKYKNLLKMDFDNNINYIESRYISIDNFKNQDKVLILLELSNILFVNNYYNSIVNGLELTQVNDAQREFLFSINNKNQLIFDFWKQVIDSKFKSNFYFPSFEAPNIGKLLSTSTWDI
jgi:hypothetical protein